MKRQAAIPITLPGKPDRIVVWRNGRPFTQAALLHEARRLAERLPDRSHVLNACGRRDAFLVAFLAALLRGQVTVLPNDRTRRILDALLERFPGLYCLSDEAALHERIETWPVDPAFPSAPPARDVPTVTGDRPAAIVFTSGSTGDPQPHEKTLRALSVTAQLTAPRFGFADAPAAIVSTVPSQHMYGLETSVALPLWAGLSVHDTRPLYPADVAAALSSLPAPRVLVTTPVHLRALLSSRARLPELRMAISATAPLSAEMAREAEQRFGAPLFEIFGFSEAGTVATRRTVEGARWRTCDGFTLRREGETCLVEAAHLPGPIPMNDVVDVISSQEFELLGRMSDNINIAGKRASLSGLNAILNDIPGVEDGAFYLADDNGGDRITRLVAFVVAPGRPIDEIKEALRREVDPAFMPRQLYLVPDLPRTATGKLTRTALSGLARRLRGGKT